MVKIHLTYEYIIERLNKLIPSMLAQEYDFVVGLARGGLVPAVHLSHALGIPLRVIEYSSTKGKGAGTHNNVLPDWFYNGNSKFLVVDDIADTGNTLAEIMWIPPSSHSFVLTYKMSSCYTPTYVGTTVPDDSWIVFPWEI